MGLRGLIVEFGESLFRCQGQYFGMIRAFQLTHNRVVLAYVGACRPSIYRQGCGHLPFGKWLKITGCYIIPICFQLGQIDGV